MPVNTNNYKALLAELKGRAKLVAVSKTKTIEEIRELYDLGQRDFGENYVQELVEKFHALPKDIAWHFIGHLQSNKVKMIADFIHLVHGIDSRKLLTELNRQGHKQNKVINCLLQVHIAKEETKFGFEEKDLQELLQNSDELAALNNVKIMGLMGMASFTDDEQKIREEFKYLKSLFDKYGKTSGANCMFSILSIGMSADYKIALEEGSNLVRIGSLLFGERVSPLPSANAG
jgi:pyridoxal phosphate enzyme, YggS family